MSIFDFRNRIRILLTAAFITMSTIVCRAEVTANQQSTIEQELTQAHEEALASKEEARNLKYLLVGLTAAYIVIYIMGRRRLVRKIWARNRQVREALVRAEESDRMKTAFIHSMSHEIRTPLNAVSGFSQVLCNPNFELNDEEKYEMQERISSNVDQITNIITEMLELSKSESEDLASESDSQDVLFNELGRNVLNEFHGKKNPGVELRFSSEVDDDFMIHTNVYRLQVALRHLLDNAVKFTEKGYIELLQTKQDNNMLFSVTDTGIGIKEKDRERIFETFSKADDFKKGLGLGLSVSQRLIKSLGGEVRLDPSYSAGCRFVISLPYTVNS